MQRKKKGSLVYVNHREYQQLTILENKNEVNMLQGLQSQYSLMPSLGSKIKNSSYLERHSLSTTIRAKIFKVLKNVAVLS